MTRESDIRDVLTDMRDMVNTFNSFMEFFRAWHDSLSDITTQIAQIRERDVRFEEMTRGLKEDLAKGHVCFQLSKIDTLSRTVDGVATDQKLALHRVTVVEEQTKKAGERILDLGTTIGKFWSYAIPVILFLLVQGIAGLGGFYSLREDVQRLSSDVQHLSKAKGFDLSPEEIAKAVAPRVGEQVEASLNKAGKAEGITLTKEATIRDLCQGANPQQKRMLRGQFGERAIGCEP